MMQQSPNVLIVEDDPDWLQIYSIKLADEEYNIITARTVTQASKVLEQYEVAVVATDLKLLGLDTGGLDILDRIRAQNSTTQVIIFTGVGGKEDAYEAMRRGALDYLTKPLSYPRTIEAIKAAIKVYEQKSIFLLPFPEKFVGSSQVIEDVFKQVDHVKGSTSPTLIWGAPGTGKALITETIHLASRRNRFVLVNCASYSATTLERILFGFQKDAFPGAIEDEVGLLELAAEGTLVLDRVNSLSPHLQRQLFLVLHEGQAQRLEKGQTFKIETRVLATSEMDLKLYVEQGLFSEDLYKYLSDSVIKLPALKDRKDGQVDDVLVLTGHFLKKYTPSDKLPPTISNKARKLLQAYDFPGNVRELEEAIRTAIARAKSGIIEPHHLPERIQKELSPAPIPPVNRKPVPDRVLCPHGYPLSDRAEEIAREFDTENWVYLSLESDMPAWYKPALEAVLKGLSFKLYDPDRLSGRENVCHICHPILSSRLAILDLSTLNPIAMYQLGLVHATGIPCLILRKEGSQLPRSLGSIVVQEYRDEVSLREVILAWYNSSIRTES